MSKPPNNNEFPEVSWSDSPEGGEGGEILPQVKGYEIVKKLGDGGMGVVYLAEQKEPIKRQVALKIIKPGMDSEKVIARFEAERQTLASLDHPNIARVFEAGTTQLGRPYFAMEYVKGVRITEYCDIKRLNIEERLELFIQVCQAIQHAHQKGIIHRDIKPSNILVKADGDRAMPKVIDFGVAKALSPQLTERTMFTEEGQLVGTPEYMSPEQADLVYQDIDTRSDIYSLGVLLYELLTGTLPFDREALRKAVFGEIQRIIREEEPPRPSTKLSSLGDEATEIVQNRQTELPSLIKRLYKELEWIPLKAMRKEPDRRYKTASELADDVRNYIDGDLLIAGPESAAYRLKKAVRRHRIVVTAVAAVLVVLATGIAVSTSMYFRTESERIRAEDAEKEAKKQAKLAKGAQQTAVGQQKRAEKLLEEREEAFIQVEKERDKAQTAETTARNERIKAEEQRRLAQKSLYLARIGLAQQAWQDGNVSDMLKLLNSLRPEQGQEDLRGFEWYYLWRLCHAGNKTLYGHSGDVIALAFSPNGKVLATGCKDKLIRLWNLESSHQIMTLPGHTHEIWSLAFSSDGETIVSGSFDKTVKLWDIAHGREQATFKTAAAVSTVALSPDNSILAAALIDGSVILWDLNDFRSERLDLGDRRGSWNTGLTFSPDGSTLAIGGGGFFGICDIQLIDMGTRKIRATLNGHRSEVRDVAFSPDGHLLASASHDSTVRMWDLASNNEIARCVAHVDVLTRVVFSPDGENIATASSDSTIKLWDALTLRELQRFQGHTGSVRCLSYSPDGRTLASGSNDATVKLWEISTAHREPGDRLGHESAVHCLAFLPDDEFLVTGCENGDAVLWNLASKRQINVLKGHIGPIWTIAISHDGKRLATGSSDRTVRLWDISSGNVISILEDHTAAVYSVAFSPIDENLVVGCKDGSLALWDIAEKKKQVLKKGGGTWGLAFLSCRPESSVTFSPDGRKLATGTIWGSSTSHVELWDTIRWQKQPSLRGHSKQVWAVCFSPDGVVLATASEDKTVKIWGAESERARYTLRGHAGPVLSVAFAPPPNNGLMASGSMDETVRLWDAYSGEQKVVLKGHHGPVTSVRFSSDGNVLASASKDNSVILWRAATPKEVDIESRDAKAFFRRGIVHSKKGEHDQAILDYNKAIEFNPRYAWAYNRRGISYNYIGEYDQAISDCSKALELKPNYADAYNDRGNAYYYKGEYDQAISDYSKAIELRPKFAEAYNNRGLAYNVKKQCDLAISDFNKAIEIKPGYCEAYNYRGLAYYNKGEYDRAISDYNKALELNTRYAFAYYNRAVAYYQRGEYDKAREDIQKAESLGYKVPSEFLEELGEASERE